MIRAKQSHSASTYQNKTEAMQDFINLVRIVFKPQHTEVDHMPFSSLREMRAEGVEVVRWGE